MTDPPQELTKRVRSVLRGTTGELTPLPGGHSGLTYAVRAPDAAYVVKAVPPGQAPRGRNDVLRQARILRALASAPVPVPRVVALDERPPAWFAMEYVSGEAIEPVLDEPAVDPGLARDRMLELVRVLRLLHDLDLSALAADLRSPTEPDALAPSDAGEEVERWTRTMHAVPEGLRPGGLELAGRLARDRPAGLPPAVLHGDFRLGNALCLGRRVRAVVDWEIWSLGDPRIDLGWFLLFADHRNFPALGRTVPNLPSEPELLEAYAGDRPAELPAMRWFEALSRMKMAAIMGHNLRRHREGTHVDHAQERLPPTIAAMIRAGHELLDLD